MSHVRLEVPVDDRERRDVECRVHAHQHPEAAGDRPAENLIDERSSRGVNR